MSGRVINAVDLFCGAGGTSQGLVQACEATGAQVNLVAVNHWGPAVDTHAANHPKAKHHHARLESLQPREVCREADFRGDVDLLVASPECTHHSRARGKAPKNDQSRASGWDVLRWVEQLRPRSVLLENVIEWQDWGPLNARGESIESRKGETYRAFIAALVSFGYRVDARVLNAADFGDATTRRRLFVQARRGRGSIEWPTPSHAEDPGEMFPGPRWRAAREVLDLTRPSVSVFARERPLAENTLRRIAEGLRRFAGPHYAEAFLVHLKGTGTARSLDVPVPTLMAGGQHLALVQPQPFVLAPLGIGRGNAPRSVERPLPTATASRGGGHLVQPVVLPPFTVKTSHKGGNGYYVRSSEEPLPTITTAQQEIGVAQAFLLSQDGRGAPRSVEAPSPTIVAKGAVSLAQPFLVPYYGTGGAVPVSVPLPTATTRDRFGLVQPVRLDVFFRMLAPDELAGAMGFPASYVFRGNRTETVRMIGNAVAVGTARALCTSALALEEAAA